MNEKSERGAIQSDELDVFLTKKLLSSISFLAVYNLLLLQCLFYRI